MVINEVLRRELIVTLHPNFFFQPFYISHSMLPFMEIPTWSLLEEPGEESVVRVNGLNEAGVGVLVFGEETRTAIGHKVFPRNAIP